LPSRRPLLALLALLAAILLAAPLPAPAAEPPPTAEAAPAPDPPLEDASDLPHISSEAPLDDDLLLEEDWLYEEAPDPLEGPNRAVFIFNESVYKWLLDPVADVYGFVVPDAVRDSVRRFFSNLREPANFVNEIIQLRGRRAGATGARFLVNSTVGLAGLFDPASRIGLERYATDFGQTLALYGVPNGPYLVVPLMGPATLRDAFGNVVDALMRPDVWLLATGPQLVFVTSDGITGYASNRIHLEELRASSFDFYVALRSAYRMDRDAQIAELRSEMEELRQAAAAQAARRDELNLGPYRVAPRRSSPRWRLLASRIPRASLATSSPTDAAQAR
jgi:phospholipid-binding lipoprotein MlaA